MEPRPSRPTFANPSILQVAGALVSLALMIAGVGALVFFGGVVCLVSVPIIAVAMLAHFAGSRLLGDRYWRFLARCGLWLLRRSGVRVEGQDQWARSAGPGTMWEEDGPDGPKALPDHSEEPGP